MSTENTINLADNITREGYKWLKNDGTELTLTYSFISPYKENRVGSYGFTNLSAFNDQEKNLTVSLLQKIAQFTGLEFRMAEQGEHSNLTFANYNNPNTSILGFAYLPRDYKQEIGSTPIWMNASQLQTPQDFEAVLSHEIGHALGLNHVNTNDASLSDGKSAMWPYNSYNGLQMADKYALQKLYGHDTYWQDFHNMREQDLADNPLNRGDAGLADNPLVTVTYEDVNRLYTNAPDDQERTVVREFLNQLKRSESQLDGTNNPFITVAHEHIQWLYENTTDTNQKNAVHKFWKQLERSEYKLDVTQNRGDAGLADNPHNGGETDLADNPHNGGDAVLTDNPHVTVTYEDVNRLYTNAPDDQERTVVREFLNQLKRSESQLDGTNNPLLEVAHEDINWLYESTADTNQKDAVHKFWEQLALSQYKLDTQTLPSSQQDIFDALPNRGETDLTNNPHVTVTYEDVNRLYTNAPDDQERTIVREFLNQLKRSESQLDGTNNPFITVAHEHIQWLYENTTDANQKNAVHKFWKQLALSEYKLDVTQNRGDAHLADNPLNRGDAVLTDNPHVTVTYEDVNRLYTNAPDDQERTVVREFLNQLKRSESQLDGTNNPFITVAHEHIQWLYENTTDTNQKNAVHKFWKQLERSQYKLDTQTLPSSQQDIFDALPNRGAEELADNPHNGGETDLADNPHVTVTYEDVNRLYTNAPDDQERTVVREFLNQLKRSESQLDGTNNPLLEVAHEDIKWLYESTTDANQKDAVHKFWKQLARSEYKLDVTQNRGDAHLADNPHNRGETDLADNPHVTVTYEDNHRLYENNGNQRNENDYFQNSRKIYVYKDIHAANDSSHSPGYRSLALEITISNEDQNPYALNESARSDHFAIDSMDSRQLPAQHHETVSDTNALRARMTENDNSVPINLTNQQLENMITAMSGMSESSGSNSLNQTRLIETNTFFFSNCAYQSLG